MTEELGPPPVPAQCPLCFEPVGAENAVACVSCRTVYHATCLDTGGCVLAGCPPPPLAPRRRAHYRLIELAICVALFGLLAAIAVPNFTRPRSRTGPRACYANQKTVVGAMEMYNLDKNTRRTTLDPAMWAALKSGGYLQSIPQDPGEGPGTSSHYQTTSTNNGILCTRHGSIQ